MRHLSAGLVVGFAAALLFFAVSSPGAVYTNTIAQVSAYITNSMAEHNVQGLSIVLVEDQEIVWARGFGYADRENGVEADADTVYHIGSCSKAFLGTAAMQLLDEGRIDLEASPTNYIPERGVST